MSSFLFDSSFLPSSIFVDGHTIFFDSDDYQIISPYNWRITRRPGDRTAYAVASVRGRTVEMHRLLIPSCPRGFVRDHIDRNGLNNRRSNLRLATYSQNAINTVSLGSGVSFYSPSRRYRACARHGKASRSVLCSSFVEASIMVAIFRAELRPSPM